MGGTQRGGDLAAKMRRVYCGEVFGGKMTRGKRDLWDKRDTNMMYDRYCIVGVRVGPRSRKLAKK